MGIIEGFGRKEVSVMPKGLRGSRISENQLVSVVTHWKICDWKYPSRLRPLTASMSSPSQSFDVP